MKRKVKIAFFIDCQLERGGAPKSTFILVEGLADRFKEYDIKLIIPKSEKKLENDNIEIIQINEFINLFPHMLENPINWLKFTFTIRKYILLISPDIIHSQMPISAMSIGLLKMLHLLPKNIKLIYTDREHVCDLKWFHRFRYRFFISSVYNSIVALSRQSQLYWKNTNKKLNVKKIYNTAGVEFENYIESFSNKSLEKRLKIIFVGRMTKEKDWDLSCKIAEMLPKNKFLITMIISYFNSNQENEVELYVNRLKNNGNVRFIFNARTEEIKKEFIYSDILIMTSKKEAFGRTAIEAMSQKCVVIGTKVGGLPEVIEYNKNVLNRNRDEFLERINFYNDNRLTLEEDKNYFFHRYYQCFSEKTNVLLNNELYQND